MRFRRSIVNIIQKTITLALVGILSTSLIGCAFENSDDEDAQTKIVLTAGFSKKEVFRIEDNSCMLPEMMVYLTNIQNQYEEVYGEEIWNTKIDGVTLEENVKDVALSKMAQVKAICVLAASKELTLDDKELALVEDMSNEYFESLNDTEKQLMGVDIDVIRKLYSEYALSEKAYSYIISDINPEISDDEARTITVEHILIKTYNMDSQGNRREYSSLAKSQAYNKAKEALELAKEEGADFELIAEEYSDDENISYSFGKGVMDAVFENASFNLDTGEISDIVETQYGYHIIKCISTFNREETDANKEKIVEERRREAFSDEYDDFVNNLTKGLNEKLWESVTFKRNEDVKTSNFFEIYDKHME